MVSVAVLGAAGGIGQPLSLLLKLAPGIARLNLYDIVNIPGVATDIAHINTNTKVEYFIGQHQLQAALQNIDIVVISAGIARKPGMTRDGLFNINASIIYELTSAIAKHCPQAHIAIITNPINSLVPIAAQALGKNYNPQRLYGVTTLDSVRASGFVRDIRPHIDATELQIPVIGGHSGNTIVPLLSLAQPKLDLSTKETEELVYRIQYGGDEIVKAKDGAGSATLSMAYAAARFIASLVETFKGISKVEYALVPLAADPHGARYFRRLGAGTLKFFAVPVQLGPDGIQRIVPLKAQPNLFELKAIDIAARELQDNIAKGTTYIT
ncbi:hypothetical protein LPJ78_000851 [Coemansia sp. RSA 989]|nr:hypothetical protein LPJ68_000906 [Coemansia sp. RSA 1086]KAJ1753815.1 hypothetical protein LPJ79_000102 [Coemansia sp. RSA 1821]KAJ1867616.1 hypothetical protein LPJ78_000851 [Coemansia sp. RSA 989]KAJ1875879.1 hypothetical protein LPJ55_000293 [Coemansia sp. RSA 990]